MINSFIFSVILLNLFYFENLINCKIKTRLNMLHKTYTYLKLQKFLLKSTFSIERSGKTLKKPLEIFRINHTEVDNTHVDFVFKLVSCHGDKVYSPHHFITL